jgi:ThiF family
MSHKLISRNADLKKLRDEGYELEIVSDTHLLVHNVPYVTSDRRVARGVLITHIELQGDITNTPVSDHVMRFQGNKPCDHEGNELTSIINLSSDEMVVNGVISNHSFSSKPQSGYANYYEKVTSYEAILSHHAQAIDSSVTARTFKRIRSSSKDTAFNYSDTNSSRSATSAISDKLKGKKVGIIGMGGTGSYVLDFISKTPLGEIHVFDSDDFLTHNAFRSPGAAKKTKLRDRPKKVMYHTERYSEMHRKIVAHPYNIDDATLEELTGLDFVFICIDTGLTKKMIVERLVEAKIPFVDTGIDISNTDLKLRGSVRVTLSTPTKNDHIGDHISYASVGEGEYSKNIQIAEVNALNAALAVIEFKKYFSYYYNLTGEHNVVYNIDNNQLHNE